MDEPSPRSWELFLEVFEALPRQGPGNRACTERALALCAELPGSPRVLDLGCGVGAQTMHLAELTSGPIVAVDIHAPVVEILRRTVERRDLTHRITPLAGDMRALELLAGSFDLVWSEGAFYNLGIADALRISGALLKSGGYVAFSDAVWLSQNPPPEVKAIFEADYPTMASAAGVVAIIEACGFTSVDHFTLPDEAWWDDYYTPMLSRIDDLRSKYMGDAEALAILEKVADEPRSHPANSEFYAYEFFVARRVD